MTIKEKMSNVWTKVGEYHGKDHRRELSGKMAKAVGMSKTIEKAKAKSDAKKAEGDLLQASADKLYDRGRLKLTDVEHKALHGDEAQWRSSMDGKSNEQIGKYLGRALGDKDIANTLQIIFRASGDPASHVNQKIATLIDKKTINATTALSAARLASLYIDRLHHNSSQQFTAKNSPIDRAKRNSKNTLKSAGKEAQLLANFYAEKAARLPSSAINGAANTVIYAPAITLTTAAVAGAAAATMASGGAALVPLAAVSGLLASFSGPIFALPGIVAARDFEEKNGTASAKKKSDAASPPSYESGQTADSQLGKKKKADIKE